MRRVRASSLTSELSGTSSSADHEPEAGGASCWLKMSPAPPATKVSGEASVGGGGTPSSCGAASCAMRASRLLSWSGGWSGASDGGGGTLSSAGGGGTASSSGGGGTPASAAASAAAAGGGFSPAAGGFSADSFAISASRLLSCARPSEGGGGTPSSEGGCVADDSWAISAPTAAESFAISASRLLSWSGAPSRLLNWSGDSGGGGTSAAGGGGGGAESGMPRMLRSAPVACAVGLSGASHRLTTTPASSTT
mmetsp:Transcript_23013/g.54724  ORF Transcript_23013/g.54724 Transcript_23013/m.54724 type:complete len:252 (+) Transcript_23013:1135-1890(+)